MRDHILFYVNGRETRVGGDDAFLQLADFLRRTFGLTGTKVVCAEGDCGSCAALVGRVVENRIEYSAVTSCIQMVFQLDGAHVVTIEGLKDGSALNPIQKSMVACQGTQCGFCTPGFVVAMTDLIKDGKPVDSQSVTRGLVGNLCRCTGYDSILKSALATDRAAMKSLDALYPPAQMIAKLAKAMREDVEIVTATRTFCKAASVERAIAFRSSHPDCSIIAGATDLGVVHNKRTRVITSALSIGSIESLKSIRVEGDSIYVGAGATLSALEIVALKHIPALGEYLARFGSPLIKNAGTLAGNLVTGSPIGDMLPPLIVLGAEIDIAGKSGTRRVPIGEFYTGYRKTMLAPDELVVGVRIPLLREGQSLKLYKISRRMDLDISTFSSAIFLEQLNGTLSDVRIAMGGVGPMVLRMKRAEDFLRGKSPTIERFAQAGELCAGDVTPISDVRGSKDYRKTLAQNILVRCWHEMFGDALPLPPGEGWGEGVFDNQTVLIDPRTLTPALSRGEREQEPEREVGRDIPHESATTHVSGESLFLDDVAPLAGELIAGIVPSPVAHGRIRKLDLSKARAIPGVVAILTHADIPGHNLFGPVIKDELLLVEDEAVFIGQPLAIIAAQNVEALEQARKAVVVEMELLPPVFTIDNAIAQNSYIGNPRHMGRGDLDAGFAGAHQILEGSLDIGGQDHFYLESQICIAVPGEQDQMIVHSSTQHPSEVQMLVAEALGVPFNHVVCICKRMGGGFGGKETQAAQPAMMAAILAKHTNRPVRFGYSKDDDMRFTGKRHPFKCVYKVGFTDDGAITALDVQLYSNGGCSTDLSFAVLERAMLHTDNAYYLPNVRIIGRVCRTNLPSNTAFRGFGGPQAVASIEHILSEIAAAVGRDSLDVRQLNTYGIDDRNETQYGQIVRNNTLPELFAKLRATSNYDARREEIDRFNDESPTHLKGLAMSAVKFGISFTRRTMNQANALVNLYQDGSVIISTGATEMGQGVHTRMRQICADALGIAFEDVIVSPTSTDKNNNTSPTAASASTDLNGAAILDACARLRERLAEVAAPILASNDPTCVRFKNRRVYDERHATRALTFAQVVCQAHEQRVNLGERGFYATPVGEFDRATGKGSPFLYFTNGVACAEVLIDRFTGETSVARVDLLMDLGKSINPGIDRGQIIGGFVQGMGWCTTEELMYDAAGNLLSNSPTTYKIPNISDMPRIFNVDFLDNPNNQVSIHKSKAVGEPPLLLGICVWLGIKDALVKQGGQTISLALPATGERILMALACRKANSQLPV